MIRLKTTCNAPSNGIFFIWRNIFPSLPSYTVSSSCTSFERGISRIFLNGCRFQDFSDASASFDLSFSGSLTFLYLPHVTQTFRSGFSPLSRNEIPNDFGFIRGSSSVGTTGDVSVDGLPSSVFKSSPSETTISDSGFFSIFLHFRGIITPVRYSVSGLASTIISSGPFLGPKTSFINSSINVSLKYSPPDLHYI